MQEKSFRILNIAAGVLLVIAGVYCLCNQDVAVLSAGLLLGIFMLASGIIEIAISARMCSVLIGSGWLMLDGVLTVIMSLFLLFNQWFTMLSLPFLFTLWLLFSGITKFVNSFDLRRFGVPGWGWITAFGLLMAVAGFTSFMDPLAAAVTLSVLAGLFLILQGVVSIALGCLSGRFWM